MRNIAFVRKRQIFDLEQDRDSGARACSGVTFAFVRSTKILIETGLFGELSSVDLERAKDIRFRDLDAETAEEAQFPMRTFVAFRTNAKVERRCRLVLRYPCDPCSRSKICLIAHESDNSARGQSSIRRTPPSVAMCFVPSLPSRCKSISMEASFVRSTIVTPEWKELLRDLDRVAECASRASGDRLGGAHGSRRRNVAAFVPSRSYSGCHRVPGNGR